MRYISFVAFMVVLLGMRTASSASLLQPQSFPKTSADIGFIEKVVLQQEGYEPWEKEFDTSGRCISGCAYKGITIQEELNKAAQHTAQAWAQTQAYLQQQRLSQQQNQATTTGSQQGVNNLAQSVYSWATGQKRRTCKPEKSDVTVGQLMPLGYPLLGNPKITSVFGPRTHPVTGNQSIHEGIDLSASIGTDVFTPASGVVESVWSDSTCGNGLRISHINGYETVYCHLSKATVKKGDKVEAGCKVAETGNSGRSTGPHLHYAIKAAGEYIDPADWVRTKG